MIIIGPETNKKCRCSSCL